MYYNKILMDNIHDVDKVAYSIMMRPIQSVEDIQILGACYDAKKYLESVLRDEEDIREMHYKRAKYHSDKEYHHEKEHHHKDGE